MSFNMQRNEKSRIGVKSSKLFTLQQTNEI